MRTLPASARGFLVALEKSTIGEARQKMADPGQAQSGQQPAALNILTPSRADALYPYTDSDNLPTRRAFQFLPDRPFNR